MNKQEILNLYKKEEDRLLVAKVFDKMELAKIRNKITNTDFLDIYQKNLLQKLLARIKYENYMFFGGSEETERTVLIFYPKKFTIQMIEKNYDKIMQVIEILLPNNLKGEYTHRDYLGGLMKLGIKREKIGDIVTFEEGAHIVILNDIIEYVKTNIENLTRFSKSEINIKSIEELHSIDIKTNTIQIILTSLRVDNVVAELVTTSRSKAEEIISSGRVFVNFENVIKNSKILQENDIITIRGKGRFKISNIERNTRKGRLVINVEQYV